MKKILAILLSVVMLLGCVVISASAEGAVDVAADKVTYLWATECGNVYDASGNALSVTTQGGDEMYAFGDNHYATFEINVAQTATYDIALNIAGNWGGFRYCIFVDDVLAVEEWTNDSNRKSNSAPHWAPTKEIELTEGVHTLKISSTNGMAWFSGVRLGPKGSFPNYANGYSTLYSKAYEDFTTDVNGALDDGYYGYRTRINANFEAVSLNLWSAGDGAGVVWNIAVYKWAGTLSATLATEAVAEKEFQAYWDRYADIEFDAPQQAGEYLFYVTSKGVSGVHAGLMGYNGVPATGSYGYNYINSEEATQVHIPRIYVITTEPYEGDLFSGTTAPGAEPDAPTFHPVSATEPTVLNIIEKGAWSENNLEAEEHKVPLSVLGDSVHDFRFGDTATFNINVAKAGTYTLALTHIWAAPSNWTISIDDAEAIPVVISKSPDWDTAGDAALGAYELTAGNHTITLTCAQEDGGLHIYALTVTPPEFEAEVAVDNQGATENHGLTISNSVTISVSYQFKTNAAFKAFSAKLGFFSPDKSIYVTIYDLNDELIQTWNPNGNEGVAADDSTGAWATFELDSELPAGEYIIQMDPVAGVEGDVLWKKYDVVDANGILTSVCDNYDGEKDTARNATPCLTFTFTEEVADGAYFAKAGETPDEPEPPVVEDTTAEDTTAEDTTAEDTTAADTTAEDTTAADTTVADTTVADTTVADTTAAGTEAGTAAGTAAGTKAPATTTTAAAGTKAPATTTTAAAAEGCKAVVGSMSAIALVAIASVAAVVLKKKED